MLAVLGYAVMQPWVAGGVILATDSALTGLLSTIIVALVGSLGYLVKAMSDRIDAKDKVIADLGYKAAEAITTSNGLMIRVIDRIDREDSPRARTPRPGKS